MKTETYKGSFIMKKLLIVESPAKIKTIGKFLGKDFKIMSTVGHIKDLPKKKTGVTINGSVEIEYVVMDDKEKVISDICKEARTAEEIYLAPDPDREGEIIAWHIGQEIEKVVKDKSKIHRITFNEITKSAITDAIEHPSTVDLQKVSAQQARRVLDRWVGYEVSPILWQKIAKGLSAGRVQSVALKLIVDRHEEIVKFKPEEYWSIDGLFGHKSDSLLAPLTHINDKKIDIKNQKTADEAVKAIKAQSSYQVESITDKERIKKPNAPFETSSLQQAAYNQLGFNVKKTMEVAQKLYEGIPLEDPQTPIALITYMRTDSLRLSDTAIKQSRTYIESKFGKDYLPSKAQEYVKGKAQDAHEAIRPIDASITPEYVKKYVSRDAARLYELIWKRFISSQMKPAVYAQRQVIINGGKFSFRVTGSTLLFDGFLKVYNDDEEDDKEQKVVIPASLKEKDIVTLQEITPKQHFTQPPARFTEASLVKELKTNGIGRPSTYATILNTIRARQYTELDDRKRFVPTQLGITVVKMLEQNLPTIMSTDFTAQMEEQLDEIAQGKLERDKALKTFYTPFSEAVIKFKGSKTEKHVEKINQTCPQCKKGELVIRTGKAGEFVGCNNYPECTFTSNFKRNEDNSVTLVQVEGPKLLDEICPKCKKHKLRQMTGKFGPFIACSGYPECKYIHQEKASFKCPLDKGDVVKKLFKGNTMWGCANYPKCKFVVFADIEEKKCPKCKLPFLAKKVDKAGNVTLYCSDKNCDYKE